MTNTQIQLPPPPHCDGDGDGDGDYDDDDYNNKNNNNNVDGATWSTQDKYGAHGTMEGYFNTVVMIVESKGQTKFEVPDFVIQTKFGASNFV